MLDCLSRLEAPRGGAHEWVPSDIDFALPHTDRISHFGLWVPYRVPLTITIRVPEICHSALFAIQQNSRFHCFFAVNGKKQWKTGKKRPDMTFSRTGQNDVVLHNKAKAEPGFQAL